MRRVKEFKLGKAKRFHARNTQLIWNYGPTASEACVRDFYWSCILRVAARAKPIAWRVEKVDPAYPPPPACPFGHLSSRHTEYKTLRGLYMAHWDLKYWFESSKIKSKSKCRKLDASDVTVLCSSWARNVLCTFSHIPWYIQLRHSCDTFLGC